MNILTFAYKGTILEIPASEVSLVQTFPVNSLRLSSGGVMVFTKGDMFPTCVLTNTEDINSFRTAWDAAKAITPQV